MNRPSVDQYYLAMLKLVASRGTCPRRQVAAILTDAKGVLLSAGYNGVPSGMRHCIDHPCPGAADQSGDTARCLAIHAEQNCLLRAGDRVNTAAVLYVSVTPCFDCAKLIISAHVKRVVAASLYADQRGVELLTQAGVTVEVIEAKPKPTIVCLCGSTRFREQFAQVNYHETLVGNIVLSAGFYVHAVDECPNCDASQSFAKDQGAEGLQGKCWQCSADLGCTAEQKVALDELHKRKIDLADEVLVLNVGGYVGQSTRSEITYALAHDKPVRYLEAVK